MTHCELERLLAPLPGRIQALSGNRSLPGLKAAAEEFGAPYMKRQIDHMETNIQADPRTAIGIARDLIETTRRYRVR